MNQSGTTEVNRACHQLDLALQQLKKLGELDKECKEIMLSIISKLEAEIWKR